MKDYIVRATAAEGQVRAFAATTKELVETPENIIIPARLRQRHWEDY